MAALMVQSAALITSVALLFYCLTLYRRFRRTDSLRLALLAGTPAIIALSFALHSLQGELSGFTLFRLAAVANGVGSVLYIILTPVAVRGLLGIPLGRGRRYLHTLSSITLLFLLIGLAWQHHRGVAVTVAHQLFILSASYTALLCLLHLHRLAEASLRVSAAVYGAVTLILLPPFYLETRWETLGPFLHSHPADALALPLCVIITSLGGLAFARARLRREPWLAGGEVTSAFGERFGLSEQELALASRILEEHRTKGATALSMQESSTAGELLRKTAVPGASRLVNLLLTNR